MSLVDGAAMASETLNDWGATDLPPISIETADWPHTILLGWG